jgi:signal transduction histidine kinase/DNA-binding response OmpR family regulator/HPt (histidine-containing phosphotransfer) domain-containing protein
MDALSVGFTIIDDQLRFVDCNETIVKILGTTKQEFLENFYKFCPEYQSDGRTSLEVTTAVHKRAMEGENLTFNCEHVSSSGELIPFEITLRRTKYKDKYILLACQYDLRNRKNMMDRIYEQSQLLSFRLKQQKLLFEVSKDFISSNDASMLINQALEKLGKNLNVSRMFIFKMDYKNFSVDAAYEWYESSKVPKLKFNSEFKFFGTIASIFPKDLPEGTTVPSISCKDVLLDNRFSILKSVDLSAFIYAPLYIDGSLWGIVTAESCFGQREWTEDEVSFFAMSSTIIAGVLMRKIYDAKLKETLEKVTNLSRAKDEFLSKISHEIRTPMNAILGITEIQLQSETQPQRKEALSIIYNSGDSLLRIINDLLDLSKIEARKLEITPVRYDIASLINDTAHLNMVRTESKPIKFKLKIDENIPAVLFGDEIRIKQVLNNILSNAFKYTHSGEISMAVNCLNQNSQNLQNDVLMVFEVIDTGQGMSEEQISRVFDEYSRFNLTGTIEGTGLGMTITRNLVGLMNGSISVESSVGKGSKFTVSIPQKAIGDAVLGKETALNLQRFRISSSSQTKKMEIVREQMPYGKVLVVDDVESNLYVAKHLLTPYDLVIETALSGFEALEKIKFGRVYDIIFMDHMMPKMDGIETVKKIRELGYKNTIIALTANAIIGQAEIFLNNGFDAFISKPINTMQLNAELNRFIRDKQPLDVLAKARRGKRYERHIEVQKGDAALQTIFARDAKKAIPVLELTLKHIGLISEDELHAFVVSVHAMKSALANIGEEELSQSASILEQAGKYGDKDIIKTQTQKLIDVLKKMVAEIKEKEEKRPDEKSENKTYLAEQLKIIKEACINYDINAADAAIANLKKTHWSKQTEEIIEKISEHLLHSDFEEAQAVAEKCFT